MSGIFGPMTRRKLEQGQGVTVALPYTYRGGVAS